MLFGIFYRIVRVFLTLLLFLFTSWAIASSGGLDRTFAGTGKTRFGFGGGNDTATATAVQADGKILVGGNGLHVGRNAFCVLRYNPDGSLDETFDVDGVVAVFIGESPAIATGIGVQGDGKIMVGGYTSFDGDANILNDFVLLRLHPDGALDSSFGVGGKVITDVGGSMDQANALTLQGDGKVVLAGWSHVEGSGGHFSAVRYTTNGALDTSFDGDGKVMLDVSTGGDEANAILLQGDGKLVLVGSAFTSSGSDFALVRLLSNGALDTSFAGTGKVITSILNGEDVATAIAIQFGNGTVNSPDRLVVAGYTYNGSNRDFAVVRYNYDGTLDNTFGGTGKVVTPVGAGEDEGTAILVTGSGTTPRTITVAGLSSNGTNNDFALIRYNSNGSMDTTLDGDGKLTTHVGTGDDSARAMTLSSGRLVVVGSSRTNSFDSVAVVRYNSDGSLDTTFDGDGKRTDATGLGGRASAYAVAIQPDGRIVIAGDVQKNLLGSNLDFALARLHPNGTFDHSFGKRGQITTDFNGNDNSAVAVLVQPDGKIIAAGAGIAASGSAQSSAFIFTRFHPNGTADITGVATIGTFGSRGQAVALQPDGKIVMAGYTLISNTDSDFALVRFNPNGALDDSFGAGGIVTTSMGTPTDYGSAVALQPDGRIVVGGSAGSTVAVARYLSNGAIDTSFDFDGKAMTPIPGGSAMVTALAVHQGKILIARGFSGGSALVRYHADGSLDTSFDGDGVVTNGLRSSSGTRAMAIQNNGKIVVAGYANADVNFPTADFAVMRFNVDGSLDASYGAQGKVTVDVSAGSDSGYGLALDGEGKALVVGRSENLFGITRLLGDVVPRLAILRIGDAVELSWPTAALGFALQTTPSLSVPLTWNDVTNSRTTNRVVVPNPTSPTFYRLKL